MITLNEIRENLVAEIKNSAYSQTKIANAIGVKQQTISEYITGKSMPALDTFARICIVLDIDPGDILCTNKKNKLNVDQRYNFGKINNNF